MNKAPATILRQVYAAIAELWCNPQDIDCAAVRTAAARAAERLRPLDHDSAGLIEAFLERPAVDEETYIGHFELDPECPLYLGTHLYEEPRTCAQAAVSDRNVHMIELRAIYRHFGLVPEAGELPDYLPMTIDFLALTAEIEDPVRRKLVEKHLLPALPPMREKLEELDTPYLGLLNALERIARLDLELERDIPAKEVGHA